MRNAPLSPELPISVSNLGLSIENQIIRWSLWSLVLQIQYTHTHTCYILKNFTTIKGKLKKFFEDEGSILIFRYSYIWVDRVRITQRLLKKHYGTHGHIHQFFSYLPTLCAIHDKKKGFRNVIDAFYQRFFHLFCSLCFPCLMFMSFIDDFFSLHNSTRSLSISLVALLLHILIWKSVLQP